MKGIFKIVLFEFNKITKNKKTLIYIIFLLIFFSLSCLAYKPLIMLKNYSNYDAEKILQENIILRDNYKMMYEYAYKIDTKLPDGMILSPNFFDLKEDYYYQYLRYDFYVKTGTSHQNYLDLKNPLESRSGLEDGVFILIFGNISFYLIGILSIILALKICISDYDNGNIKNLIQSKLTRREITIGKVIFLVISIIAMVFAITVTGLLISNNGGATNVLVIGNGKVRSINTYNYFISKMMINLICGLSLAFLGLFFKRLVKNTYFGGFLSISCYFVSLGIYSLISSLFNNDIVRENVKLYFVFINTQVNDINYYQLPFYFILIFYTLTILALYRIIYKKEMMLDL
jgi:ABC-type transport system involved in multi-copper enzyme maturation permease subunit